MITTNFCKQESSLRTEMRKEFKKRGYDIKEKRFALNEVLGYVPNMKDMTDHEKEKVIQYLKGS